MKNCFSSEAHEIIEVGEFPGVRGDFSSWEVREGLRFERRFGSVERSEWITGYYSALF